MPLAKVAADTFAAAKRICASWLPSASKRNTVSGVCVVALLAVVMLGELPSSDGWIVKLSANVPAAVPPTLLRLTGCPVLPVA
ncbi:MAG: hypothetical protein M0P19_13035, partial [Nevskia sp.]|nr:hypothetical protein [Nevskia sp.]